MICPIVSRKGKPTVLRFSARADVLTFFQVADPSADPKVRLSKVSNK
jgi:hypothetical protein